MRRSIAFILLSTLAAWGAAEHARGGGSGDRSRIGVRGDDEDRFLRGLAELDLPEVLEHYLRTHPPTDAIRAAEFEITLERMRLNDRGLGAAEREAIVRRMLARRGALIETGGGTHRDISGGRGVSAVWLADQASDSYFELLPIESSGMASLIGLASPAQSERAAEAARLMFESAAAAEHAIQQAMLDLEAHPEFAQDAAMQARRRRLAEEERDRRIPFLLGVGAELHARLNVPDEVEGERLHAMAHRLLAPLTEILEGPLADEARFHAGLAAASRGLTADAERHWQSVRDDPMLRFASRLALAQQDEQRGLERLQAMEREYEEARLAPLRVLLADAQCRHALRHEPARAVEAYARLLDVPPAALGADPLRLRDLVLAKVMLAIDEMPPPDGDAAADEPALLVIAQAERAAQPSEAVALLRELLERPELEARDRAIALFRLGRASHRAGREAEAAARLIQLARDFPDAPEAERAIELGVSIAAERFRVAPAEVAALLDEGLRLLIDRYAHLPTIDRWRFVAGQVAMAKGRFDEAADYFGAVRLQGAGVVPGAGAEARLARVRAMRAAAMAEPEERRPAALRSLLEAADETLRELEQHETPPSSEQVSRLIRLRIIRAEAMLGLGDAAGALDALPGRVEESSIDGATIAELLRVRIACYEAQGRAAEAGEAIDRFVRAAPGRAAEVLAPMLDSMTRRVLDALETGREEQAKALAQAELAPIAARLHIWLQEAEQETGSAALLPRIAEAYRHAHRFDEAIELYDRLLAEAPHAAPHLLGRAECLFHLGEDHLADAMLIYRRLIASGPAIGHDHYWLAQLRALQVLDRVGRNTHQIVPQIQRLRQMDASLGGERYRRAFETLQNRYVGE